MLHFEFRLCHRHRETFQYLRLESIESWKRYNSAARRIWEYSRIDSTDHLQFVGSEVENSRLNEGYTRLNCGQQRCVMEQTQSGLSLRNWTTHTIIRLLIIGRVRLPFPLFALSRTADFICPICWNKLSIAGHNGYHVHHPTVLGMCGQGFEFVFSNRARRRRKIDISATPSLGKKSAIAGLMTDLKSDA